MFSLRAPKDEDLPFVLNSWLRSYRLSVTKRCPSDVFYAEHQKIIKRIWAECKSIIACSKEDENQIFGYVFFEETEPPTIHFTYVKSIFTKLGVGSALLVKATNNSKKLVYTHNTPSALFFKCDAVFNPYILGKFYGHEIKKT